MHNHKEDNNQYKINKKPKAPENQTAWNSDSQRIKEKKSTRTTRPLRWQIPRAKSEKPWQGGGPWGWGWLLRWASSKGVANLRGKLRFRSGYGLQRLRRWEKLPVSQKSLLESGATAKQVSCIVPSLAPPGQAAPQPQQRRLPCRGEHLRPHPLTTYQVQRDKEIGPK